MGSSVTPINKQFGFYWVAWVIGLFAYMWWFDASTKWDIAFVVAFFVGEIPAIFIKKKVNWRGSAVTARDTLSQCATWVSRMSKDGTPALYSWNATVVLLAFHVSVLIGRQPQDPWFQGAVGGLCFLFLVTHWLHPNKYG